MFCTMCGARLVETDRFCDQCGAAVKKTGSTTRLPSTERTPDDAGTVRGLAGGFAIGVLLVVAFGVWIWLDGRDGEPTDVSQLAVSTDAA